MILFLELNDRKENNFINELFFFALNAKNIPIRTM